MQSTDVGRVRAPEWLSGYVRPRLSDDKRRDRTLRGYRMEGQLRDVLTEIERPGSFVVRREAPASALQLEVRGVGPVTFPISATKARALCASALLARHGFKDQTRLDKAVRDTWEIPKVRLKIDQKRWHEALVPELDRIRQGLGLASSCTLRAELHNLLVYAPGQFFVPHQDSEKEDGMIGTLVVTLPSKFTGGATIVKHHDEKVELRGSSSKLGLVAFYADCHHEVQPVEDGYRIVLTYNLLLSKTSAGDQPPASDQTLARLERRVREFFETPPASEWSGAKPEPPPDRLVYLLDHQYTQKGLSWSHLKNADAIRVAALREVAKRLDCEVALALADVHETWSCEEEDLGYGRSRRRRRGYRDDDDSAPVPITNSTPELVELQDWEVELRHFVDAQGKAGAASGYIDASELCYTKPSVDLNPFKAEHEGYMGNWGNTVDRWYHRAAVVLWPRERTFIIRAKSSAKFALDELASSLKREGLEVARRKAEQLMPFWARVWHDANDSRLTAKTLSVALELDSPKLALGLVLPLSLENLTSPLAPVAVDLLERYGFEWLEQALAKWHSRERADLDTRLPWLSSIQTLIRALTATESIPAQELANWLVAQQWAWLSERHRSAQQNHPAGALKELARFAVPTLRLVESSLALKRADLHDQIQRTVSSPEYPVLALVNLLETARRTFETREAGAPDFAALDAHCISELEQRLARPTRPNDDWSITPPARCSCQLCIELSRFLVASDRTRLNWPLAESKRAHIHGVLDAHDLPVTHTTRRTGSPYTLVLTKTSAVFERDAAERAAWQRGLDALKGKRPPPQPRTAATRRAGSKRARDPRGVKTE